MRKFLLLTYHFPPSNAAAVHRMLGLARYLPRFGWQPVVVAPTRVPWEPEDASLLAQVPPQTPVERIPFAQGFLGKIARRMAPEAHWLVKARGTCWRMIREHHAEAILTSGPPHCVHLLGLWLQWRTRLPWIACFRDPWISNMPITHWTFQLRRERWWERQVMKRASVLVANTPLNEQSWQSTYPQHASKMVTITNSFDAERFASLTLTAPKVRHERVTILHAGELYTGRDPRPLLQALQQSETGPDAERLPIQVEFLGRTTEAAFDFPTEIRQHGLEHCVRLSGQVPYAEALQRMMQADILLLLQTPGTRFGVPGKLYEYMGLGRPILALAEEDGDIAWVLRASKVLHRIAPPTDVAKIKQAVLELTRAVQAGQPAVPDKEAVQQFTRERMAQKIAECLDRCVARTNAPAF